MLRPWKRRVSSSRIPTSRAPAAAVRRSTSKRGRFFVQLLRFQKSELKNASADAGAFCLQQQTLLRIVGRADRLHRLRNGGVGWCIAGWRGDNNTASADLLHPGIVDEEPLIVFFVVVELFDRGLRAGAGDANDGAAALPAEPVADVLRSQRSHLAGAGLTCSGSTGVLSTGRSLGARAQTACAETACAQSPAGASRAQASRAQAARAKSSRAQAALAHGIGRIRS